MHKYPGTMEALPALAPQRDIFDENTGHIHQYKKQDVDRQNGRLCKDGISLVKIERDRNHRDGN